MADSKVFYWLKLKEDFFEDDTIRWLEEQENGKEYTLFYLKLCLKSLNLDGTIIRIVGEKLIPYDKKALARLTNTDIDTVTIAMNLFTQIGLVDVFDTGEIYMKQVKEMVGSKTEGALRKEKYRKSIEEKKRDIVPSLSQNCPTENRDKRIENREQRIEKELQQESSGSSQNAHSFYQVNFGIEPPTIMQDIEHWIVDLNEELVIEALKKTVEAEKPYSYAKGILRNWIKKGIKTLADVEAETVKRDRTGYQVPESVEKTEEENQLDELSRERLDAVVIDEDLEFF